MVLCNVCIVVVSVLRFVCSLLWVGAWCVCVVAFGACCVLVCFVLLCVCGLMW